MKKMKGRKGSITLKLDMKKAISIQSQKISQLQASKLLMIDNKVVSMMSEICYFLSITHK